MENHSELMGDLDVRFVEFFVIAGKINVGDNLEYDGETAIVSEQEDDKTYSVQCVLDGKFYNSTTLLAKIKK